MAEIKPNAETFRILALTSLASKDVNQARLEIRKALELEPRWESIRYTAATVDYFTALAVPALPDRVVSWPDPVDWSLVRRDSQSIRCLKEAAKVFRELADDPEKSAEEHEIFETWYLASLLNDPERQEEAAQHCRKVLQSDPTNYGAIAWAVSRRLDVDLAPSEKALRSLLDAGDGKIPHILALVSCHLAAQHGPEAMTVLKETKSFFEQHEATGLWLFWYAQALCVAGAPETALKAIESVDLSPELRSACSVALRSIAKKSRDFRTLIEHLERSYEQTHDPSFLLEACEVKSYEKEWSYVADKAQLLAKEVGTAEAVRMGAIAAFNARQFKLCLELLDTNRTAFSEQKLPNELRRMRVLCHHRLGTLPTAVAEAEALGHEEPTTENLLALAQIYFDKGDFKGLVLTARRLILQTDLTSDQLLRIARLIQWDDRDLAISIWRRSVERDLSDEAIAIAVSLGYQLGLDDELRPLLKKMFDLAARGTGHIRAANIQDIVSRIKEGRVHNATLVKAYRNGSAPIHLIAEKAGIPLADFYHRLLQDNEANPDPINQPVLFAIYGGHSFMAGFPKNVPQWHLNLDITAIFLAEHLAVLDDVTKVFKPLRISSHLITALVEMRDRMAFPQPSRLRVYEQVIDFEQNGHLRTVDCQLPPDYPNTTLVQELGPEWVALYEHARSAGGYLVDFVPLTKLDLSGPPTGLPDNANEYLTDCRSIVETLRHQGPLSEEDYLKALENLGDEGGKTASKVLPQGALLFCQGTIPEMLASAGLLRMACARFQVRIEKSELERVRTELRIQNRKNAVAQWLSALIERLRKGFDQGTYELIVAPVPKDDETANGFIGELTTQCMTDLLGFQQREGHVLWIDDRHVNAYSHRDGMPIIGIIEILKALVSAKVLKQTDYYNKLISLRAANVRFIPIEKDEILFQLSQAKVEQHELVETQSLTILRRYVSTCLLQIDIPQWPPMPQGAPNENGEIAFFIGLGRAIVNALVDLWKTAEGDEPDCEARSEWLVANLFQEHMALNNPTFQQRPQEDYQYVVTLRLVDLVSTALALESHREPGGYSVRQRYFNWLFKHVLQKRFDANPYLAAAIANVLKRTLFDRRKEIQGNHEREIELMVLQSFFEDLPDPIRNELILDVDFMASIGLKPRTTISLERLIFENSQFWSAVAVAVNGGEFSINSLVEEHEVRFRHATGRGGQVAVSFTHPVSKKNIILDDDVVRLAVDSAVEREEILRRNSQWFDCRSDILDQIVARIVAIEDVELRIEEVKSWKDSSASVYYAALERRLTATPQFKSQDLLPPSVEGLLRYLRISSDVKPYQSFATVLDASALTLIRDVGLRATINRLWGLPVPIPNAIVEAVCKLSKTDRRKLMKGLLKTSGSPVSKLHLLALVRSCFEDSPAYQRLARRIIRRLLSSEALLEFEAFGAILNWVSEEFGHWQELLALTPRLRLALVWVHANTLFANLLSAGAASDQIADRFSRMGHRLPHELFRRELAYWFDIAHPRQINRTTLLFSGLAYSLGKEVQQVLDAGIHAALIAAAFQVVENIRLPVLPLLKDPTLASNSLESFLGGDRGETFLHLLGDEQAHALSRDSLLSMTQRSIEKLAADPNEFSPWAQIFGIIGDMPPYKETIDRLSSILKQTDFCRVFEEDKQLNSYTMFAATTWATNIADGQLREHLKEQLVKICELQSRSINELDGGANSPESERTAALFLESALNVSRAVQPPDDVHREFSDLVIRMVNAWPKMVPVFRPVVQRICDELPIAAARYLYPLLLRLRAS